MGAELLRDGFSRTWLPGVHRCLRMSHPHRASPRDLLHGLLVLRQPERRRNWEANRTEQGVRANTCFGEGDCCYGGPCWNHGKSDDDGAVVDMSAYGENVSTVAAPSVTVEVEAPSASIEVTTKKKKSSSSSSDN